MIYVLFKEKKESTAIDKIYCITNSEKITKTIYNNLYNKRLVNCAVTEVIE